MAESSDLAGLTVRSLRDMCHSLKINVTGFTEKRDFIEAIEAATGGKVVLPTPRQHVLSDGPSRWRQPSESRNPATCVLAQIQSAHHRGSCGQKSQVLELAATRNAEEEEGRRRRGFVFD